MSPKQNIQSPGRAVHNHPFRLSLSTDKMGTCLQPPQPEPSSASSFVVPGPGGWGGEQGGEQYFATRLQHFHARVCAVDIVLISGCITGALEPILSSPGPPSPPCPSRKELAEPCSRHRLGPGRCFLAARAQASFLSPQSNAPRQRARVALGLLSP